MSRAYLPFFCLMVSVLTGLAFEDVIPEESNLQSGGCNILRRGFSKTDAAAIVSAHNEKRQIVASGNQPGQPSATNMHQLYWDEELAESAQRWADKCVWAHDPNKISKKYGKFGQNLGNVGSSLDDSTIQVQKIVNNWFNEVKGFSSANISPYKSTKGKGHYTQVVWAKTSAIGCGFIYYKNGNMYEQNIVCNYGPVGNVKGREMYKPGKPCIDCEDGCSQKYNALCK